MVSPLQQVRVEEVLMGAVMPAAVVVAVEHLLEAAVEEVLEQMDCYLKGVSRHSDKMPYL
jgi:hypothetical protein